MTAKERFAASLFRVAALCLSLSIGAAGPATGLLRALLVSNLPLTEQSEDRSEERKENQSSKEHKDTSKAARRVGPHSHHLAAAGPDRTTCDRSGIRPQDVSLAGRPHDSARDATNGIGAPLRC